MKIASIVGARPQFVKAGVVSRALRSQPGIEETLIHTGQHYDEKMSRVFFEELELPQPRYNLGVGSGPHGEQTGKMLIALESVLLPERADFVIVYGDTNSTLAGALVACKLHIPVAHVEAGLRSFNRWMPEEINRVLTDHAADLLFAPTATAVKNLCAEGIHGPRVLQVGDVMYDAALYYAERAQERSHILGALGLATGEYILLTVHRAENADNLDRLRSILGGLKLGAPRTRVIFPVHPRTRHVLQQQRLSDDLPTRILCLDPVSYLDMVTLEKNARLIVTDSGGVQKEAFFYSVPCVTVRDETEWVELIELGWNRLGPPCSCQAVAEAITAGLQAGPGQAGTPYGDGRSSAKIAAALAARG